MRYRVRYSTCEYIPVAHMTAALAVLEHKPAGFVQRFTADGWVDVPAYEIFELGAWLALT